MHFSMSRPICEKQPFRDCPRRKPAPVGVTTATKETFVGPLDSVLDASTRSLQQHGPIVRKPSTRNLTESAPLALKPARMHPANATAEISHLNASGTLIDDTCSSLLDCSKPLRKRKVTPPPRPPAEEGDIIFKVHPVPDKCFGKKQFAAHHTADSVQTEVLGDSLNALLGANDAPSSQVFHKRMVCGSRRDTQGMLRFSPRVASSRPSTAPLVTSSANAQQRESTNSAAIKGRSDTMRSILSWTGATPRYNGKTRLTINRTVSNTKQFSAPAPFDAPFRGAVGGGSNTALTEPGAGSRKRVGPHRVSTRPKSARGLLTWVN